MAETALVFEGTPTLSARGVDTRDSGGRRVSEEENTGNGTPVPQSTPQSYKDLYATAIPRKLRNPWFAP